MKVMRMLLVASILLLAGACAKSTGINLFPYTDQQLHAKQVLEFREDQFLLGHNQKMAHSWKDYLEARQRLVDLWKARKTSVFVDSNAEKAAEEEIRQAKVALLEAARRLREQSAEMASQADKLVKAVGKVPPLIQ